MRGRLVDVRAPDGLLGRCRGRRAGGTRSRAAAKLLFVNSPNNPDGSSISATDLARLLRCRVIVVLDEAYVEFAAPATVRGCRDTGT